MWRHLTRKAQNVHLELELTSFCKERVELGPNLRVAISPERPENYT